MKWDPRYQKLTKANKLDVNAKNKRDPDLRWRPGKEFGKTRRKRNYQIKYGNQTKIKYIIKKSGKRRRNRLSSAESWLHTQLKFQNQWMIPNLTFQLKKCSRIGAWNVRIMYEVSKLAQEVKYGRIKYTNFGVIRNKMTWTRRDNNIICRRAVILRKRYKWR